MLESLACARPSSATRTRARGAPPIPMKFDSHPNHHRACARVAALSTGAAPTRLRAPAPLGAEGAVGGRDGGEGGGMARSSGGVARGAAVRAAAARAPRAQRGARRRACGPRAARAARAGRPRAAGAADAAIADGEVEAARAALRALGKETSAGARCGAEQRAAALEAVAALERAGDDAASPPATSPLLNGAWRVVWTDAPPPSNGALGPVRCARVALGERVRAPRTRRARPAVRCMSRRPSEGARAC